MAKNICLRQLAVRARTRVELAAKLRDKGVAENIAEQALDRLTAVGLIDDEAFADAFVRSRHRDRGLGRAALKMELERKGIDRELAARAVAVIDDDDERERAAALVAKKLDSAMFAAGPQVARRRLLGMLARRGYGSSVAIAVINDALNGYVEPWDQPDDN